MSELLVSLAVLGLIAGLTVPSILASVDKSKNNAKMKEAVQVISQVVQEGYLNGDFETITIPSATSSNAEGSISAYFSSKLSYVKQCLATDNTSEGCKFGDTGKVATSASNITHARWILQNGVKIQARDYNFFKSWVFPNGIVWRVFANAYDNNPVDGKNTFLIACNISDSPTNTSAWGTLTIKPGMCGNLDGSYNSALGI